MRVGKFGKVRAVFEPKHTEDMKVSAFPFIGQEGIFEVLWEIEPDDSARYAGQWAMRVPKEWIAESTDTDFGQGFIWVPEEDLRVVDVVDKGWPQEPQS